MAPPLLNPALAAVGNTQFRFLMTNLIKDAVNLNSAKLIPLCLQNFL